MRRAVAEFVTFDDAYARIDWRRFNALPTFDVANRGNAYNVYLQMEQEALGHMRCGQAALCRAGFFSVACDAARVGFNPRTNFALVLPTNNTF